MKKINFSIEGVKFNIQVDDNDEISVDVALSDKCCNKPAQVISANGVSDLDSVAIATALSLNLSAKKRSVMYEKDSRVMKSYRSMTSY